MRLIVFLVIGSTLFAAHAQKSPFNNLEVNPGSEDSIVFLVGGHFHGSSDNISGFPAATIIGNLDVLNNQNADFLISLGDLFLSIERDMKNYPRVLFNRLNMPVFNAVGNHDVEEDNYAARFGQTAFSFNVGNNVFIVLDTERDNGDFDDKQLALIKEGVSGKYKNVFLFAHRPIWAENNDDLDGVFKGNTRSGTNFDDEVLPLIGDSKANVYVFGGSLGGESPFSFFYHRVNDRLTYIATAVRNLERDGVLKVVIRGNEVFFEPISLTGQDLQPLEYYNIERWRKTDPDKGFNWRLVPLYLINMVSHRYFWYGILWSIGGILFLLLIRRIWLRRIK